LIYDSSDAVFKKLLVRLPGYRSLKTELMQGRNHERQGNVSGEDRDAMHCIWKCTEHCWRV